MSGYIVVAAGREDSRGLGSPMTEFLPRRPRVLGSPRSVALAKEGVPPEWEPGCGTPRRQGSAGPGWKALAPRIALCSNAGQNVKSLIILARWDASNRLCWFFEICWGLIRGRCGGCACFVIWLTSKSPCPLSMLTAPGRWPGPVPALLDEVGLAGCGRSIRSGFA